MLSVYLRLMQRAAVDVAACWVLSARMWLDPCAWSDAAAALAEATEVDVREFFDVWLGEW